MFCSVTIGIGRYWDGHKQCQCMQVRFWNWFRHFSIAPWSAAGLYTPRFVISVTGKCCFRYIYICLIRRRHGIFCLILLMAVCGRRFFNFEGSVCFHFGYTCLKCTKSRTRGQIRSWVGLGRRFSAV